MSVPASSPEVSGEVDSLTVCMYVCMYVCIYLCMVCMVCMHVWYVCMYSCMVCMYGMYVCMYVWYVCMVCMYGMCVLERGYCTHWLIYIYYIIYMHAWMYAFLKSPSARGPGLAGCMCACVRAFVTLCNYLFLHIRTIWKRKHTNTQTHVESRT
jgi:hypothetical protein